ncbi:hypothetical protein F5X98DRAFT_324990 [Xylaria grammica]|nr:hypothetical protein F5X98DRAFT_324990 [Xylaria grammica]
MEKPQADPWATCLAVSRFPRPLTHSRYQRPPLAAAAWLRAMEPCQQRLILAQAPVSQVLRVARTSRPVRLVPQVRRVIPIVQATLMHQAPRAPQVLPIVQVALILKVLQEILMHQVLPITLAAVLLLVLIILIPKVLRIFLAAELLLLVLPVPPVLLVCQVHSVHQVSLQVRMEMVALLLVMALRLLHQKMEDRVHLSQQ